MDEGATGGQGALCAIAKTLVPEHKMDRRNVAGLARATVGAGVDHPSALFNVRGLVHHSLSLPRLTSTALHRYLVERTIFPVKKFERDG